jgi:VWFA-related protein
MIGPSDAAFLARFAEGVVVLADFLNDTDQIDHAFQLVEGTVPWGPPALYDALVKSRDEKFLSRDGHKGIVLVADGRDHGSRNRLEDVGASALRNRTAIFVVSLAHANPYMKRTQLRPFLLVAKELAGKTGGDVYFARNRDDIARAFNLFFQELSETYTLTYFPRRSQRDGKYHNVKLQTLRKHLRVLAPLGY